MEEIGKSCASWRETTQQEMKVGFNQLFLNQKVS